MLRPQARTNGTSPRYWWYQIVTVGRARRIRSRAIRVSGSDSGRGPEYCGSQRRPIGCQCAGKLRFRSTPRPFCRTLSARPSGLRFASSQRSSRLGLVRSRRRTMAMPAHSSPWMQPTTRIRHWLVELSSSSARTGRPRAEWPRRSRRRAESADCQDLWTRLAEPPPNSGAVGKLAVLAVGGSSDGSLEAPLPPAQLARRRLARLAARRGVTAIIPLEVLRRRRRRARVPSRSAAGCSTRGGPGRAAGWGSLSASLGSRAASHTGYAAGSGPPMLLGRRPPVEARGARSRGREAHFTEVSQRLGRLGSAGVAPSADGGEDERE